MLDCRHEDQRVVLEAVPGRASGRLLHGLLHAGAAEAGPIADTPAGITRDAVPAVAAYLLTLVLAAAVVAGAQATPYRFLAGPAGAALLALLALLLRRRCRACLAGRRVSIATETSELVVHGAGALAGRVLQTWPFIAVLVPSRDPRPALHSAIWEITRLLARAETGRARLATIERLLDRGRLGHRVRGELVRERHITTVSLLRCDRVAAERLGDLRRLAEACEELRRCQQRGMPEPSTPGVGDLATNTETVVLAYRELLGPTFTHAG